MESTLGLGSTLIDHNNLDSLSRTGRSRQYPITLTTASNREYQNTQELTDQRRSSALLLEQQSMPQLQPQYYRESPQAPPTYLN